MWCWVFFSLLIVIDVEVWDKKKRLFLVWIKMYNLFIVVLMFFSSLINFYLNMLNIICFRKKEEDCFFEII